MKKKIQPLQYIQERTTLKKWLISKPLKGKEESKISPCTELTSLFTRELPDNPVYKKRLTQELDLIEKNNFSPIFLQVMTLLSHTKDIPHIVRGSAAGSLVSYMLGITHIDPIEHNMSLARFMNRLRPNKPDIDLDFPQHQRDTIIEKLFGLYPNRIGRVCNHVMWREKSAKQEAIRKLHYNTYNSSSISTITSSLLGKKRYDATHCGGVIIFPDAIPKQFIGEQDRLVLDKREVENEGLIKIDVLSNRGLSILQALDPHRKIHEYPFHDTKITELLLNADVIGVTYCETPVIMKILRLMKPTNPVELSLCLALIRPAPDKKLVKERLLSGEKNLLVYDDDVIEYISEMLECDDAEGETMRKKLIKGTGWEEFQLRLRKKLPLQTVKRIVKNVQHVAKYSFCKSHACSYGYLCWAILWHKAHNKENFWKAVMLHGKSQYENWVYYRQALHDGFDLEIVNKKTINKKEVQNKKQTTLLSFLSKPKPTLAQKYKQLKELKMWHGEWMEDCGIQTLNGVSYIKGIVACVREYKVQKGIVSFITLGISSGQYINVSVEGSFPKGAMIVEALGKATQYEFYALSATYQ